MMLSSRILIAAAFSLLAFDLRAASEIAIAIRYLQAEGTSHSHVYLYREDGKFLRQLTSDNSGQDVDPVFAPGGEIIVFTREKSGSPLEFWSVPPLGGNPTKLDSVPDWYEQTKTSNYFTNRDTPKPAESASPASASTEPSPSPNASAARTAAGIMGERQTYKAPDGSVEIILREDPSDPDDQVNGERHGKHYVLRYLKTGIQADFGTLPGFFGAYEILHERQNPDRQFLFEGLLRVAFFGLHLNSTDGDTSFALARFKRATIGPIVSQLGRASAVAWRICFSDAHRKSLHSDPGHDENRELLLYRTVGRAAAESPICATESSRDLLRCIALSLGAHTVCNYDSAER